MAVIPKVTRDLPMQGASSVRSLPHIKDLTLADRQFDSPGKIDILLGQDIWQDLFLPGEATGPPGTPSAWNTVFGWVIMGNYSTDGSVPQASISPCHHSFSRPRFRQSSGQVLGAGRATSTTAAAYHRREEGGRPL